MIRRCFVYLFYCSLFISGIMEIVEDGKFMEGERGKVRGETS